MSAAARAAVAAWMAAVFAVAGPAQAGKQDACRLRDIPAADIVAQVPFELVDGRIYVEARANGQGPFRFAVDTGASGLARADAKLVSTLRLPVQGRSANSDGVKVAEVDSVRFDTLQLGGLGRSGIEAITRDYRGRSTPEGAFDGILAREFFADGLLVIDYPAQRLTFSRTKSIASDDRNALAYQRAFRIPLSIGALQAVGNLDTGANVALVLPKALYDRLDAGPLRAAGQGQLANGAVDTWRTTVQGPIRIGNIALSRVEARVSERYPELLVGAHALQQSVLIIDQRSRRLALCPQH
ncbi:aspartyl protease family protein [Pseudoxanthomonas helianthi]|uniref:Aspartyl protease family protein n=1 Tax=Pseudoxanthomonas helianthi TaxID=1453541 RepID=A0A941AU61_9GAMM|nr:aspartyl protease family protein [Pseudoxanthomonas helianthi]MBP3984107.1 aspartyl protease family protein [Pseudoxanthomonas helianthi]